MNASPASTVGNALDPRGIERLRATAGGDPRGAARQAAVQLEAQFLQMVMKSMRDASPAPQARESQDAFTGMLDSQFAQQFAGRKGGLAEMVERQLNAQMRNLPPSEAPKIAAPRPAPTAEVAALAPQGAGNKTQAAFVQRMLPHAQAAERATGVPASFILGQAALESGWGRGEIRQPDGGQSFNLFGIKAGGAWRGASAQARTTEYEGGQAVSTVERFRSYASYADAFTDYARLIAGSPRYAAVVRNAGSVDGFAQGMQRAGYASDPNYASKLTRTINHMLALQQALG